MYDELSSDTVAELISTLRYLKREFISWGRVDAINMAHVDAALDRVSNEMRIDLRVQPAMRAAADPAPVTDLAEMMRGMLFRNAAEQI